MRQRVAVVAVFGVVLATLVGCTAEETSTTPPVGSALPLSGDFSGEGPGSLRSVDSLPTIDRRLTRLASTTARITFESQSGITGSLETVSGTVFSPAGTAPSGGWPIVALGHPTTGVREECAPSLSPSLLGSADAVAALLKSGYVVTVPDYQGLGVKGGYHPYLDSTTVGHNMIDSVRAARKVVANTSDRWAAFGTSQGGQASWAANELAAGYGAGLTLVGSVSVSPAADVTGLIDAAVAGRLTREQSSIYPLILYALKAEHPDLDLDMYRRGVVSSRWDVLTACEGPLADQRTTVVDEILPDDLVPASARAAAVIRRYLADMGRPKSRATEPMLVLYGGRDQLVNPAWTANAIRRACRLGSEIQAYVVPGGGHDDIDVSFALTWLNQRFDGSQTVSTCNRPEAVLPSAQAPSAPDAQQN